MSKYNDVTKRILVDIDNERRKDCDVVGLTKSGEDYIINYEKEKILLHEGDYVYMYTEDVHLDGEISYIFSEGYVIFNPYEDIPYKWCCRIVGNIEYLEEYNKRFNV
ncbi:hypothetical protein DW228_22940 [Bacteroides fragilis]|mgnify:CR=1 FL=1|uniref:Uncharacterized protein n=1 Tax=Bacteroides fragilis TaxID=817 RepID=A0A396BQC7_BACFG|nr:hypothetical protein [Bacteroides fragilis]RHH05420.1 hypothetical protein DW228_22940 [Bacteroides fragilis]